MTKVTITGQNRAPPSLTIHVDGPPEKAAEHPRVKGLCNVLKRKHKTVEVYVEDKLTHTY